MLADFDPVFEDMRHTLPDFVPLGQAQKFLQAVEPVDEVHAELEDAVMAAKRNMGFGKAFVTRHDDGAGARGSFDDSSVLRPIRQPGFFEGNEGDFFPRRQVIRDVGRDTCVNQKPELPS